MEDYFQRPKSSSFKLSPDGKYLSYLEKDNQLKRHVFIKEVATGKVHRIIEEREELIRAYAWVSDERLLYAMDEGGNENYHIFTVNIDGSDNKNLTPCKNVKASVLNMLREQKNYVIILMNKDNPQGV